MWNVPEMQPMKREAVETVRTRFGKFPLWGFKDPRTARLLPFWQDIFKHLGIAESYVLIIRNPISVARSLKVRNQFAFEKSYLLWLEHSVEAYTHTCGMPRVVVDYDALMAHPGEQLGRIAERLALPSDPAVEDSIRDYAHGFLDHGLGDSAFEPTDAYLDTHAPDLVANTYDMLRQVALDQLDADSKEVQSALSSARSGLGGFAPFFSYSDLLEAERDSIRHELEEVRDKSREELQRTLAELEALKTKCQLLEVATESLKSDREALRSENEALKRRAQLRADPNAILRSELHDLWNSRSWGLFRPLRNFIRKRQGLEEETEPIVDSKPQLIQAVITIRESLSWELTAPLRVIYRMLPSQERRSKKRLPSRGAS